MEKITYPSSPLYPHVREKRRWEETESDLEMSYRLPIFDAVAMTLPRPFSVFFPKPTDRNAASSVGRCPSIWFNRRVSRIFSRFMRERFSGRWSPQIGQKPSGNSLAIKSIANIAYIIVDFLNWLFAHGVLPEDGEYVHVTSYQGDVRHGRWGAGNAEWANVKADEACTLLRWMAYRNHRKAFSVPTKHVSRRSQNGKTVVMEVRVGREKQSNSALSMIHLPDEPNVLNWLEDVRKRRGRAKSLACRAVIELGTRKWETCSIEVTAWPSAADIAAATRAAKKSIRISLTRNTKNGRPRAIDFDLSFAHLVRVWIDGPRKDLAAVYCKRHGQEPIELFLSDAKGFEGTPVSTEMLYKCFKLKSDGIRTNWYPHLGRHYSICKGILNGIQQDAATLDRLPNDMPLEWVTRRTNYWLDVQRRKSGHVSARTTETYTRWIELNLVLVPSSDDYIAFLEEGDDLEV